MVVCVLSCDGLATCPGRTPPLAHRLLELGTSFLATQYRGSVSVQRGHTVTLPCWLSSSQSAEDLEIRWYRGSDQFDTPILLYKTKAFDHTSQKASYAGRVSFGLKEGTSGGLKTGDVSLNLENVTVEDIGDYTCFVSSFEDYDSAVISLRVTETGSPPLLSAVMKHNNEVNVSCESEGWLPKPELRWSDKKEALTPADVSFGKNSAGLYSVHSWLLVPSSFEVSCSVGLSNEVPKSARMKTSPSFQDESGSSSAGWLAFGILLAAVVAAVGALYFRKKTNKHKSGNDEPDGTKPMNSTEESQPLLSEATWQSTPLSETSKCYVNVQLEDKHNQLVTIRGSKLRDNIDATFPDGDRVTCLTAVRGKPGFSSGQHYWEVSLARENVDLKKSWWVGVTDRQEIPNDESLSPTIKNGFWFLSSCPNQEHTVQLSTEPKTIIYVQSEPKKLGVYLDFDNKELSFYNVEGKCLIGSLAAKFTGELFPVFNPGKGDESPMEVLHRPGLDQSNNTAQVEKLQNAEPNHSGRTENSEAESSTLKENVV
ncbi:hypothetical protein CHARACLAT_022489 [Characodon lateralis]|uniref:Uncharacterized protein n=1 Tax=Characodon lateralis TaxID=208331 RepID=A0ABU7EP41_9TELE|nr:hypothetical protein [Characodon lateralis]